MALTFWCPLCGFLASPLAQHLHGAFCSRPYDAVCYVDCGDFTVKVVPSWS